MSLEAAAVSARGGFGCLFSSSDEYETALITERRAQGRYGRRHGAAFELSCLAIRDARGAARRLLLFERPG
jgi:hypothetical protein